MPARTSTSRPLCTTVGGSQHSGLVAGPASDDVCLQGDLSITKSAPASVTAGQTLMIIEAMKTMNPVPAPRAGTVVELLVGDGQPVEFGEPLLVLE